MRVMQFAAILALFVSCGPALSSPLVGRTFEAVRIGGGTIAGDNPPTITFEALRVSGHGGCNRYGATADDRGRYLPQKRGRNVRRIAVGRLNFGPISATRMYCGPGSTLEARFFDALNKTRAYRLSGSELRVLSGGKWPRVLMTLRAAN